MMFIRFSNIFDIKDIKSNVVYGTHWYEKRLNHTSVRTSDGALNSFDVGPTLVQCTIIMKGASAVSADNMISFINTCAHYTLTPFTVHQMINASDPFPTGQGVDLGNGKGIDLLNVRYLLDNTEGMITPVPPGLYDINLPIAFVRP